MFVRNIFKQLLRIVLLPTF